MQLQRFQDYPYSSQWNSIKHIPTLTLHLYRQIQRSHDSHFKWQHWLDDAAGTETHGSDVCRRSSRSDRCANLQTS